MLPARWQRRPVLAGLFIALASLQGVAVSIATPPPHQAADPAEQVSPGEEFAQVHDRAVSAFLKGKLDEALIDFDRAIALSPKNALAYYNRGNVRFALRDVNGAIADYSEAIKFRDDFGLAYMNRGSAYSNLWRLDEAIADLDEAVRLEPKLSDAFYNRAIVHMKRGDRAKGMGDYEQMLKLDRSVSDDGAENRFQTLLDRGQQNAIPDDPTTLTSEISHGRITEYLLALLERSCLAAGHDAKALTQVASKEGWFAIPESRLRKEPGGEALLAGWTHRFLESIFYVILSKGDDGRSLVCSVSAMPISDHMLEDFKGSLKDRFKAVHAADIKAQDRDESRYTLPNNATTEPQDLQVVHRKSVRFVTLRTTYASP